MIEHGVKYEGVKLLGNTHQKVFRAGMLSSALNLLFFSQCYEKLVHYMLITGQVCVSVILLSWFIYLLA